MVIGFLVLIIIVQGFVFLDIELCCSNVKFGDWIYVIGNFGDVGVGLDIFKGEIEVVGEYCDYLINCYYYFIFRVMVGILLCCIVNVCIDVFDGLVFDLGYIFKMFGCGVMVYVD